MVKIQMSLRPTHENLTALMKAQTGQMNFLPPAEGLLDGWPSDTSRRCLIQQLRRVESPYSGRIACRHKCATNVLQRMKGNNRKIGDGRSLSLDLAPSTSSA